MKRILFLIVPFSVLNQATNCPQQVTRPTCLDVNGNPVNNFDLRMLLESGDVIDTSRFKLLCKSNNGKSILAGIPNTNDTCQENI